MAERLEFDTPAVAPASGERRLEFDPPAAKPSREQELRAENLKLLMARGEPGYTERVADAVTSGVTRPITGLMRGVTGVFDPTSTFGERYRAGVGAEEDYYQRSVKNTPGPLGTATDVIGSVVGAGKATAPAGLGKQALQAGVQGAIEGGARNAEDLKGAAGGAAFGGATSAAASTLVGALTDRLKGVSSAKRAAGEASRGGSAETLKEAGGEVYKRLDDAGIKFGAGETPKLAQSTADTMAKKGYDKAIHADLNEITNDIGKLKSGEATWGQLQALRERLAAASASDDKQVRRMAGALKDNLDQFIDTARPTIPAKSVGTVKPGDPGEARDLWKRGSQAEQVDYLASRGMRSASDPATKLSRNFESFQDRVAKPGRYDPFSDPTQKALMDRIVEGSPKTTATAGALDRWGNNLLGYGTAGLVGGQALSHLMPESGGAGGATTGAGAAAIALGLGAKGGSSVLRKAAAEQGMRRVDDLVRNIVGPYAQSTAPSREVLAKLLSNQDLKRAVGNYAGSFINAE